MKRNLFIKILFCSFMTLCSLKATESISLTQTKNLIKKQTVYIISINKKTKWFKNSAKVKNYQSVSSGFLEYRHPKIDFSRIKKDRIFIISSKEKSISMRFVKNLKKLGFSYVKYLEGGEPNCVELLTSFRGIKLFSIFKK